MMVMMMMMMVVVVILYIVTEANNHNKQVSNRISDLSLSLSSLSIYIYIYTHIYLHILTCTLYILSNLCITPGFDACTCNSFPETENFCLLRDRRKLEEYTLQGLRWVGYAEINTGPQEKVHNLGARASLS